MRRAPEVGGCWAGGWEVSFVVVGGVGCAWVGVFFDEDDAGDC